MDSNAPNANDEHSWTQVPSMVDTLEKLEKTLTETLVSGSVQFTIRMLTWFTKSITLYLCYLKEYCKGNSAKWKTPPLHVEHTRVYSQLENIKTECINLIIAKRTAQSTIYDQIQVLRNDSLFRLSSSGKTPNDTHEPSIAEYTQLYPTPLIRGNAIFRTQMLKFLAEGRTYGKKQEVDDMKRCRSDNTYNHNSTECRGGSSYANPNNIKTRTTPKREILHSLIRSNTYNGTSSKFHVDSVEPHPIQNTEISANIDTPHRYNSIRRSNTKIYKDMICEAPIIDMGSRIHFPPTDKVLELRKRTNLYLFIPEL
jgi:hypothetical protein